MGLNQYGLKITLDARDAERSAKRAGDELGRLGDKTDRSQKSLDKLKGTSGKTARAIEQLSGSADKTTRSINMLTKAAAGYAVIAALRIVTNEFREYEKALVGVGKTADLSGRALFDFGDDITNLSLRVPVATKDLLEIAEAAGQLGVRGSANLQKFTETVARLISATDMAGADSAKLLARILTVTGEGTEAIDRFGSVLVALGNNFAASESEIIRMTNEVARSIAIFDVGAAEAAALGVAMRQMGVRAEAGGTAVGRAYRAIDEALRGTGDDLTALQELTGMTRVELKKLFDTDPTSVFLRFSQGLGKVISVGGDVTGVLSRFGLKGEEILKVLPVIAKRSDELARAIAMANEEMEGGTALIVESNKAFDTYDAKIKMVNNRLSAYATVIGEDVAGATLIMFSATNELAPSIDSMRDSVETAKTSVGALAIVLAVRMTEGLRSATVAQIAYQSTLLTGKVISLDSAKAEAGRAAINLKSAQAELTKSRTIEQRSIIELRGIKSTHGAMVAERELEIVRMQAQITQQGSMASATRLAAIRKSEVAITAQLAMAERGLATSQLSSATAAKLAMAATVTLSAAQAGATFTARALTTAMAGLRVAYAFIGGPLGVAALAAWGIYEYVSAIETAEEKTRKLSDRLAELTTTYTDMGALAAKQQLSELQEKLNAAITGMDDITRGLGHRGRFEYNREMREQNELIAQYGLEIKAVTAVIDKFDELGVKVAASLAADETSNLAKAQKELFDTLYPLQTLGREYAADLILLDELQEKGLMTNEDIIDAQYRLRVEYKELFPVLAKNLKAEEAREKQRLKNIAADSSLIKTMEYEYKLIGMTDRQRAIETAGRKVSVDAIDGQREAVERLAASNFDAKEELRVMEEQAKPFADAWEEAAKRIDHSFASAWEGAFDSFSDFAEGIKNAFKSLLANLAHLAITKPILISMGLGVVPGASAGGMLSLASMGSSAMSFFKDPSAYLTTAFSGAFSGASDMLWTAATSIESTLASWGFNGGANGVYNTASALTEAGGSFGFAGGVALSVAGGIAGSYAGNSLGESLFGKEAESNWGSAILGTVGTFLGGPIGAFVGSLIGGMLDVAFGGDGKKRVTLGIEASNRDVFGDALKGQEVAASGLQLSALSKRTDDGGAAALTMLDTFLKIDALLTGMAESTGVDIDLSHVNLVGGASQAGKDLDQHFFGSGEFNGLSKEELAKAPAEFIMSWIDATDHVFSEAIRVQLQALDGTAEEIMAGYTSIFEYEHVKDSFLSIFDAPLSAAEQTQNAIDDLSSTFLTLTGNVLPETRQGLQDYITSIDLQDQSNKDLVMTLTALSPVFQEYLSYIEAQSNAQATINQDQSTWLAWRGNEILEGYKNEKSIIEDTYKARITALKAEHSLARKLLAIVDNLRLSDISPLSSREQLDYARNELGQLQVMADTGDMDAIGKLGGATQTYLKLLSAYVPNSDLYSNEFEEQVRYLEKMGISMGGMDDTSTAIKALNQQMVAQISSLGDSVEKELDYLARMADGIEDLEELFKNFPKDLASALSDIIKNNASDGGSPSGGSIGDKIADLYRKGLGRDADAGGYAYWSSLMANGKSYEWIKKAFAAAADDSGETYTAFAKGTSYVPRDMRADLHQAEMVIDANTSSSWRKYGIQLPNLKGLEDAMRGVQNQVAELQKSGTGIAIVQHGQRKELIDEASKARKTQRRPIAVNA